MQKKISGMLITAGFCFLFYLILSHPAESVLYAFTGLTLWFQKMIPALFPFMILTGLMIRMELTGPFARLLLPAFKPLFKGISVSGVYCIIMGFLCGFPMGAKVVSELYGRGKLSYREASFLLAFCNNIGPVYFTGYVMPLLGITKPLLYVVGMYGIPLLYGMVLSRILKLPCEKDAALASWKDNKNNKKSGSILVHLDSSILSAIESITRLGGYMILFNLLNLVCLVVLPEGLLPLANALLEVTSGIGRMKDTMPVMTLVLLTFGGLSCMAQTYSIIRGTGLSFRAYCRHKGILTVLTALYYGILSVLL